jgi:mannose-P-dolichol utilization defect protein 1
MDALRSVIQPITHNLPAPIRDLGVSLIGQECYSTLLLNVDLADEACLKLAVSKGLGLGIVAASSIVKVPQILKLARSQSAAGVSFLSYLLETAALLIGLAYNARNEFPFSTYGETALILVQNIVISVLVLRFSGRGGLAAVFVAALAGAAGALFSEGVVDMKTLGYLQAGAGTLGVASKIPQILAIWQQGGTGQLSAFTVCCTTSNPVTNSVPDPPLLTFLLRSRSSTTSSALSRASSPLSRRSTISSSSTGSSPASPSTSCSPPRWCTTGTRRPLPPLRASPRPTRSRSSSLRPSPPPSRALPALPRGGGVRQTPKTTCGRRWSCTNTSLPRAAGSFLCLFYHMSY